LWLIFHKLAVFCLRNANGWATILKS
jgi:hypothetical protein